MLCKCLRLSTHHQISLQTLLRTVRVLLSPGKNLRKMYAVVVDKHIEIIVGCVSVVDAIEVSVAIL